MADGSDEEMFDEIEAAMADEDMEEEDDEIEPQVINLVDANENNEPLLRFFIIEDGERQLEVVNNDPLDRNIQILMRNVDAIMAERFAVIRDNPRAAVGWPGVEPVGAVERAAELLIEELQEMIDNLVQQRDDLRQLLIQRGLLDPFHGQWDQLLEGWVARSLSTEYIKIKNSQSLEDRIVDYITNTISYIPVDAHILPTPLLFRLYVSLYTKAKLEILGREWRDLDRFQKVLDWKMRRLTVHKLFNGLSNGGYLTDQILFEELKRRTVDRGTKENVALYDCALNIGIFLLDHGSFAIPSEIFRYCQKILNAIPLDYQWRQHKLFELNYWLLKYYMKNCSFAEAINISSFNDSLIDKLLGRNDIATVDFAQIQTQSACLWYELGEFKKSLNFCIKALDLAKDRDTQISTQIEILCITAKNLVVKRHFTLALKSICFAVTLVLGNRELERQLFSVLCDYGDCLLNSDCVEMAVKVYTLLEKMIQKHFGTASIPDGQAMYEYARAAYNLLYDNYAHYRGNNERYVQVRSRCFKYANKAVEIFVKRLNGDHYQLIRAEQLQALLLVKKALRNNDDLSIMREINNALKTHLQALENFSVLSNQNANCAWTYCHLASLYCLSRNYARSEEFLEKALEVKNVVFGTNDHEIALTLSSLAYLYVKELNRPREALALFKKCLEIEINTFGKDYSGLGSIYDGMTLAYEAINDFVGKRNCQSQLQAWKTARDLLENTPQNPFGDSLINRSSFQEIVNECCTTLLRYRDSQ